MNIFFQIIRLKRKIAKRKILTSTKTPIRKLIITPVDILTNIIVSQAIVQNGRTIYNK